MMEFIQTGNFKEKGKELYGRTGLIDLDYMNDLELQTDIVLKSYKRILYNFERYGFHNTGVSVNNDELVLFYDYENIENIQDILNNKEYFNNSKCNYWWNVENDWMLIPNSKKELFVNSINYDYTNWWMKRPEIERNYDYELAMTKKLTKN